MIIVAYLPEILGLSPFATGKGHERVKAKRSYRQLALKMKFIFFIFNFNYCLNIKARNKFE